MGVESTVEQAEVHGARGCGELEAVGCGETGQAVGALLKLVAHAETPIGRVLRGLGECGEVQAAGVIATNDHGEGVFKTQRLGDGDVVALGVEAPDGVESGLRVTVDGLFEDCCQGGAGVFDVGVDAAGNEGLMADVASG